MAWIKRNLYFLISSLVAVALLGLAGFYFYSNWKLNNDNLQKLNDAYGQLDQLVKQRPNPGNNKVNNIEIANQQRQLLLDFAGKERAYFRPIAPIPNPTNHVVTKEDFASGLRRTLDELTRAADAASVTLPPKYDFSFEAERSLTIFAEGSLPPLSRQLGEVKAICTLLFQAKINSLDNLRRERVSPDDSNPNAPAADYLDSMSVTNQLAILTPYEVSFHCFSGELAAVLDAFGTDPHGFIVRAINVESGAPPESTQENPNAMPYMGGQMAPGIPAQTPTRSYTLPGRGPLPVMLDEKQFRVTLAFDLVKLLPNK